MKKREQGFLVCRLATDPWTVEGSSFNRRCSRCTCLVMIAPTGQKLLDGHPELKVLCLSCFQASLPPEVTAELAGPAAEIKRELKTALPNMWRYRN